MAAVQGARSLGYGDITPQGHYPQAAAAFEAVIGVLYTVILLSRLVGMEGFEQDKALSYRGMTICWRELV